MADTADLRHDTPDVGAAVQALKPQLRNCSIVAFIIMLAIGLATLTGVIWVLSLVDEGADRWKFSTILLIFAVFAVMATYRQMRRKQESLVMPVVAAAVGLAYSKDAKPFLKALPPRLLPGSAIKTAEDYVCGRLGNHTIQMAEVVVETGGKNSRTLFRGVVAQFPNSIAMPAFFLAPEAQTRPGMIFKAWIPTDGLYHLRDVTGPSGETYGVWTSWSDMAEPPALTAVIEVLTSLQTRLDIPMTLFTATSDGTQMHIALEFRRDLFRIGGMFPEDSQMFSDVYAATRDLSVPLSLVRELVAVEVAAAEKSKALPPT